MKKILSLIMAVIMIVSLVSCGGSKEIVPDYEDAASFEAALNEGEDLTGKTVRITVDNFIPDGTFGYTIWSGEHLNFCSGTNPGVEIGDTIIVKATEIVSALGSYMISFEKVG